MDNTCRTRYGKFFRRLIATSQPQDIQGIVDRYDEDRRRTEENLHDIIIISGGMVSYKELMTMPIDSMSIFVERLNKYNSDKADAMKRNRR